MIFRKNKHFFEILSNILQTENLRAAEIPIVF
jgi:hypothetical protein